MTEDEKTEVEYFYKHPHLHGLMRARDLGSYAMRCGALVHAGLLTHEDAARLIESYRRMEERKEK